MKALALVDGKQARPLTMKQRIEEAMESGGWQRGIIRARRQFADDDRRSALHSAALGYDHEAQQLHLMADQHEQAMDEACRKLGRVS